MPKTSFETFWAEGRGFDPFIPHLKLNPHHSFDEGLFFSGDDGSTTRQNFRLGASQNLVYFVFVKPPHENVGAKQNGDDGIWTRDLKIDNLAC